MKHLMLVTVAACLICGGAFLAVEPTSYVDSFEVLELENPAFTSALDKASSASLERIDREVQARVKQNVEDARTFAAVESWLSWLVFLFSAAVSVISVFRGSPSGKVPAGIPLQSDSHPSTETTANEGRVGTLIAMLSALSAIGVGGINRLDSQQERLREQSTSIQRIVNQASAELGTCKSSEDCKLVIRGLKQELIPHDIYHAGVEGEPHAPPE